jgi:hypothetical protein
VAARVINLTVLNVTYRIIVLLVDCRIFIRHRKQRKDPPPPEELSTAAVPHQHQTVLLLAPYYHHEKKNVVLSKPLMADAMKDCF